MTCPAKAEKRRSRHVAHDGRRILLLRSPTASAVAQPVLVIAGAVLSSCAVRRVASSRGELPRRANICGIWRWRPACWRLA